MDKEYQDENEELLHWFNTQRLYMWEELSKDNILSPSEKNLCRRLFNLRNFNKRPSIKQLKWAKSIVEKKSGELIENNNLPMKESQINNNSEGMRHLTARVAWHDNMWNGDICKEPEYNEYCNGEHSLLSRRLHERKPSNCDANKGKTFTEIREKDCLPPCYWCINLNGTNHLDVEHDNPAAPNIEHIHEELPPYSIFSWPFKLSFVKNDEEYKKYGKYYPEKILEARIKNFQSKLYLNESIVFLYANYDNPVSGEEQKYLLIGCAFLKEIGDLQYFNIPDDELKKIRKRPGAQNFPRLSWNLRYSLDMPENGIILPYHEYLELGSEGNEYLDDMKVIIEEPELIDGFKYVAMDVDNDQAIYLLMKIRKSILKIQKHKLVKNFDVNNAFEIIKKMLKTVWYKRGHFPAFTKLAKILIGNKELLDSVLTNLITCEGDKYYKKFIHMLERPDDIPEEYSKYEDIFDELNEEIEHRNLSITEFLTLSMLDLTTQQFINIIQNNSNISIKSVSSNPYVLFENYEPIDEFQENNLGEKTDGYVDLYKIDIALFPDREYIKKIRSLQNYKIDDKRRIRAIIIEYLTSLEGRGDCFDEAYPILKVLKEHPLFYRMEDEIEYHINEDFRNLTEDYKVHLEEKLVIKKDKNRNHSYYYLKKIYEAEQYIKELFLKLLDEDDNEDIFGNFSNNIESCASIVEKKLGDKFDREQFVSEHKQLYNNVFKKKLFILSGSPGSGKSYEILQVIETLLLNKESCLVLTPTGKAALRLNSDNSFKFNSAQTIDKFLHNNDGKSIWRNIIIDEMSMVDIVKFYELMLSLKIDTSKINRIILVGDQYQLPPIGFGKVFHDIITFLSTRDKYKHNYISLSVNCRQESDDLILDFAKIFSNQKKNHEELFTRILNADSDGKITDNFYAFYWENRDDLHEKIFQRLKHLLNTDEDSLHGNINKIFGLSEKGFVDKNYFPDCLEVDSFQIITPYRTSYYGALGINNIIQNRYKTKEKFISNDALFKHGDKVILVKNNYYKGKLILSNGSMGIVNEKGWFYFPEYGEPTKNIDSGKCELAYAITVHKSQGSGFKDVFVIIPEKISLLSRELIYTALTRSRHSVSMFIYGENGKSIEKSIFNKIRNRSFVDYRKTSLFEEPAYGYSYFPEEGMKVKSRVEYIIYKKLQELQEKTNSFTFEYEAEFKPVGVNFIIHPDFRINLSSGRQIFWEHLGMLTDKKYKSDWEKRYQLYIDSEETDNVITTDEIHGIDDAKIERVIHEILQEQLHSETDIKYSKYHYSLA